ncbi:MAG: NAD(P)-dependent oxidoreductase [Bacteroides oleiciplenus]|nr:NAD(P)-dependent oxidoreductase [Bacteroides oleiciplenus]
MRILLTGATGFLGSHIAEALCALGYDVLLTKRTISDIWRCATFADKVRWTDTDSDTFETDVLAFQPSVIINSAWHGVSAHERDSWHDQLGNLYYQQRLLDLAKQLGVKVFIGIGSQAEYGIFDGCIDEEYPANPNSAYGAIKLAAQKIVKAFCDENYITWYWFRLFSCFGEREGENWLIPSVITRMLKNESEMDFTGGEQVYSYLYVRDLGRVIAKVCTHESAVSGIYNLSSQKQLTLQELIKEIQVRINTDFKLNFGVLPYRVGQPMKVIGDSTKFVKAFGPLEQTSLSDGLETTIKYYQKYYESI